MKRYRIKAKNDNFVLLQNLTVDVKSCSCFCRSEKSSKGNSITLKEHCQLDSQIYNDICSNKADEGCFSETRCSLLCSALLLTLQSSLKLLYFSLHSVKIMTHKQHFQSYFMYTTKPIQRLNYKNRPLQVCWLQSTTNHCIHFFFFSCVLVNHWSSSFLL